MGSFAWWWKTVWQYWPAWNAELLLIYTGVVVFAAVVLFLMKRSGRFPALKPFWMLLLVAYYTLILVALVFSRAHYSGQKTHLLPFYVLRTVDIRFGLKYILRETVLNILLFFPIGVFLQRGVRGIDWKQVLLFSAALSLGNELLQLILSRGVFETDDVLFNSAGALLGFLAVQKLAEARARRKRARALDAAVYAAAEQAAREKPKDESA